MCGTRVKSPCWWSGITLRLAHRQNEVMGGAAEPVPPEGVSSLGWYIAFFVAHSWAWLLCLCVLFVLVPFFFSFPHNFLFDFFQVDSRPSCPHVHVLQRSRSQCLLYVCLCSCLVCPVCVCTGRGWSERWRALPPLVPSPVSVSRLHLYGYLRHSAPYLVQDRPSKTLRTNRNRHDTAVSG